MEGTGEAYFRPGGGLTIGTGNREDAIKTIPKLTRRRLLTAAAGLIGGAGLTAVYAVGVEPVWVHVARRDLPIAGLPAGLDGRLMVQISDLHVGVVNPAYLNAAVDTVSSLKPDLTVITGDLMHSEGAERVEAAADLVGRLRPGPLGVFAVPGNHDYGKGWAHTEGVDRLSKALEDRGVRLLRNEVADVGGLQLLGVDDLWGPFFPTRALLPESHQNRPTLALCHNPDGADAPVWDGFQGWILSGHTHGGQVKPPFLPPPILPVQNRRYTAGEFDLHDGRRLYVNPGLGYLKRVRFNVRPEITAFRLLRV